MKVGVIAAALVLAVICPAATFAGDESCAGTREYLAGKTAGEEGGTGWGMFSFGVMTLTSLLGLLAERESDFEVFPGPFLGVTVAGALVCYIAPGALSLRPKDTPSDMSTEETECYLEGYRMGARHRNRSNAGAGFLLSLLIVVGPAFAAGILVSAFMNM